MSRWGSAGVFTCTGICFPVMPAIRRGPVWLTPKSILHGPDAQVSDSQRQAWIQALREEIKRLEAER